MSKHTQEPWLRSSDDFVAAESDQLNNGEYILSCFGPDQAANARRIVACVNACRGLPTDELEQKGVVAAVGTELLELDRQCGELLAALVATTEHLAKVMGGPLIAGAGVTFANGVEGIPTIMKARAAIAKTKGGAA
ncbi:hypothetical protein [Aeromonas sp. AE23HZ002T15]